MRTMARIPRCKTRAFTLVEVIIAAMITVLVVLSATAITLQFLRTYQYEEGRITTNHDIRNFTEQMTSDAAHANCFFIYPNFSSITTGTVSDPAITEGAEGDYLVLVTTGYNQVTGATTITKVVGYYRVVPSGSTTNIGALYRYSFDYSAAPIAWPAGAFYTWLIAEGIVSTIQGVNGDIPAPAAAASSTHKLFEASVVGDPQASPANSGQLFYDFMVTGIMVKAEIEDQSNPNLVKVIDTYNLTIAPHG
jgi:type II secretory pathway pseudopilin PulG